MLMAILSDKKGARKLRILISTGIFPPKIGGPAQYAKNLSDSLQKMGHDTEVRTYTIEERLPTGVRHFFFFLKILPAVFRSDFVIILDTFSVGLPTVLACKLFGKKNIIRTGGDFLWEGYVERTKKKVLLRDFYESERGLMNLKEKTIFSLTRFALQNTSTLVFSTDWQRDIFLEPYELDISKTKIVENFYGGKEQASDVESTDKKIFVASTRNLVWKNLDVLERVFAKIQKEYPDTELFTENLPYNEFMQVMKQAYAVVLVSLGDISPNMTLDAIRYNKPLICTKEVGIYDRIKSAGIFVDPLNEDEIEKAFRDILDNDIYMKMVKQVSVSNFVHTWDDIAKELMVTFEAL